MNFDFGVGVWDMGIGDSSLVLMDLLGYLTSMFSYNG